MTPAEALELRADLEDLKALRTNRIFLHHFLPEIERLRAEHRTGMRDMSLSAATRCEHVTAWEDAQALAEFLDKKEAQIRRDLHDHDKTTAFAAGHFTNLAQVRTDG